MDVRTIFLISRPWLWLIPLFGFLGGLAYRFDALLFDTAFFWVLIFLQGFSLTFPFGFAGYGLNNYFDRESDKFNFRKKYLRNIDWGFVYGFSVFNALFMIFSGLLFGLFFGIWLNLLFMVLLVFLGWSYSSFKFRLKEVPVVSGFCNYYFYVLGPLFLSLSLSGLDLSMTVWIQLVGVSFYGVAATILANIVDYSDDLSAGFKTLPVRIGVNKAGLVSAFFGLLGFFLVFPETLLYRVLMLVASLLLFLPVFVRNKEGAAFFVSVGFAIIYFIGCVHYVAFRLGLF